MKTLLQVCLFITGLLSIAQNGQCDTIRNIIDSSVKNSLKEIQLQRYIDYLQHTPNNEGLGDCYHDYAFRWFYNQKENLDSAIYYTKAAVAFKSKRNTYDTFSLKKSNYNLAFFHLLNEEHFDAKQYYSKVIDLGQNDLLTLNAHYDLGLALSAIGDYEKTRNHFSYVIDKFDDYGENQTWLLLASSLDLLNLNNDSEWESFEGQTIDLIAKLDSLFHILFSELQKRF